MTPYRLWVLRQVQQEAREGRPYAPYGMAQYSAARALLRAGLVVIASETVWQTTYALTPAGEAALAAEANG